MGKIFHWKHGWIPVGDSRGGAMDEARRKSISTPDSPHTSAATHQAVANAAADARHQRFLDAQNRHAGRDEARRERYADHLNATAAKRAATAERYRAAQAKKRGA